MERGRAGKNEGMATLRSEFDFRSTYRRPLACLGVTPSRAWLTVDGGRLLVRFGPWMVDTALTNVDDVEVTGPYRPIKAIGPHVSMADRGLTFGTNADRGVCLRFSEPVRGIDPAGAVRHPGLTVTVEDPEGVAADLRRLTTQR